MFFFLAHCAAYCTYCIDCYHRRGRATSLIVFLIDSKNDTHYMDGLTHRVVDICLSEYSGCGNVTRLRLVEIIVSRSCLTYFACKERVVNVAALCMIGVMCVDRWHSSMAWCIQG